MDTELQVGEFSPAGHDPQAHVCARMSLQASPEMQGIFRVCVHVFSQISSCHEGVLVTCPHPSVSGWLRWPQMVQDQEGPMLTISSACQVLAGPVVMWRSSWPHVLATVVSVHVERKGGRVGKGSLGPTFSHMPATGQHVSPQ